MMFYMYFVFSYLGYQSKIEQYEQLNNNIVPWRGVNLNHQLLNGQFDRRTQNIFPKDSLIITCLSILFSPFNFPNQCTQLLRKEWLSQTIITQLLRNMIRSKLQYKISNDQSSSHPLSVFIFILSHSCIPSHDWPFLLDSSLFGLRR